MQSRPFRKTLLSAKSSSTEKKSSLEEAIRRELLRQAYHSYNLALVVTACSALISLADVGLLYLGKTSAASVATAGGVATNIGCIQFAKQSKEELCQILDQLK